MIFNPQIVLEEMLYEGKRSCVVQQNGIDLTVEKIFRITPNGKNVSPADKEMFDRIDVTDSTFLSSDCVYEIRFHQYIAVPKDACAWLQTRSSFVRNGAQCWSGLYDSGFKGQLGCVLKCHAGGIVLRPGDRLVQLIVSEGTSDSLYEGQWNGK